MSERVNTAQPVVSVIIPVYNLEHYVRRCLDSVVGQSIEDIEIICVNDGSTDGSLEILKDYGKKDPRIRVIDQENRGQGFARNAGINMAKGEYIGFVDGDDWIEAEMYETMYAAAKQNDSDLHLCTVRRVDADGNELGIRCDYEWCIGRKFENDTIAFSRCDVADEVFKVARFCWNKIYKSAFLKKNKIFFSSIRCYEDNIVHFRSFFEAERISITRKPFYNYRINRAGASSSKSRQILALFDANREVKQYLEASPLETALVQRFDNYRIRRYLTYYYILERKDRKQFFARMSAEFQAMDASSNPFVRGPEKMFYLLVRAMPYPLFACTHIPGYVYFYAYMRLWLRNQNRALPGGRRMHNIDLRDVV